VQGRLCVCHQAIEHNAAVSLSLDPEIAILNQPKTPYARALQRLEKRRFDNKNERVTIDPRQGHEQNQD
tara:strand:- start:3397 stop:3603 length:207 start_codon:yes stop_codon:yes gene_type:complete